MKRRRFIQALGGAAALLGRPPARASTPEVKQSSSTEEPPHQDDTDAAPVLPDAYAHAVRQGRALLVLVVPDDEIDFMSRGKLLGGWLVHGQPERLAPLVFAELACATVAEVRALVPHANVSPTPVAVLIETGAVPAGVTAVTPEPVLEETWRLNDKATRQIALSHYDSDYVDSLTELELREKLSTELKRLEDERRLPHAVEALSKAVYTALAPNRLTLMRRIEQLQVRAPATAALATLWMESQKLDRMMAAEDLRNDLHRRAVDKRITGSTWATHTGCGTVVRGKPSGALILCGMGHVPKLSATFLYFFHRS